jgi:Berberine and berberine like
VVRARTSESQSLTFRLHPIEKVLSGHLKYPIRVLANVLAFIKDYAPTIPDEMFLVIAVLPYPGERMLDIGVVWPGEPSEGLRALQPLRTLLKPFADTIEVRDYLDEQRAGSDSPEEGVFCSRRRSGHLSDLTSASIAAIVEHGSNAPSEECGINLLYWHGPWSSKPRDNSFGFRRVGDEYWIHSYWRPDDQCRTGENWVDQFYAALAPLSTGAVYVNGLENEGEARARASYGAKYDRLPSLKRQFDPENIFRLNQNIEPATD